MTQEFTIELSQDDGAPAASGGPLYRWRWRRDVHAVVGGVESSPVAFSIDLAESDLEAFVDAELDDALMTRLKERVRGLFPPADTAFWPDLRKLTQDGGGLIRLVLRFSPSTASRLAFRVPWELAACDPDVGRLAPIEPYVSVVRYWPQELRGRGVLAQPLRIALFKGFPGPEGSPHHIRLETEVSRLQGIVERLKGLAPGQVESLATWAYETRIQEVVALDRPAVVVFLGHGTEEGGEASLETVRAEPGEGQAAKRALLSVETFAHLLTNTHLEGVPRLVILSACSTVGSSGAFEKGAAALLQAGVGAVVAIQGKIKIEAARVFVETLFERLLEGSSVDAAALFARREIARREGRCDFPKPHGDWARPILLVASLDREAFSLSPDFAPEKVRRRRRWRGALQDPTDLSAEERELANQLLAAVAGPGVVQVWERGAGQCRRALDAALGARLAQELDPLLYLVELRGDEATCDPLLIALEIQAGGLEDLPLGGDARAALIAGYKDPEEAVGRLHALRSLRRVLVLTGCVDANACVWKPLLAVASEKPLEAVVVLAGTAAALVPGAFRLPDPGPAAVLDLEALPDLSRRVLGALALLRTPASPIFVRLLLDEPAALVALPKLLQDLPELVERTEAGWSLRERFGSQVASRLLAPERRELHRRACALYLEQAGE